MIEGLLTAAVVLIAIAIATAMLIEYFESPAALWRGIYHDRNGHFQYGLSLALAIRSFDLLEFIRQILSAKIWPPIHGLVLSLVLLAGGLDYRLGILPSLIGWTTTLVMTWLIACRLFTDRLAGITAGIVAVSFVAASPAFRLLGADVMLEGLGAALMSFALYAYLRSMAAPDDARWWRILAIALTILFFEKSNYWLLTAMSLAMAFLSEDRPRGLATIGEILTLANFRRAATVVMGDPIARVFAALVIAFIVICAFRPMLVELSGRRITIDRPADFATLAYALLFLGAASSWWRHRVTLERVLGTAGRAVFYLHMVPVGASFLLRGRLSAFLWYVGPANSPAVTDYNPWHAALFQWTGFAQGFHVAPWAAVLALGLAVLGAGRAAWVTPGGRAVAILSAVSAAAVILHPQQQWRFQATWLFAVWICSGAGASSVLTWLTSGRSIRVRSLAAAATAALLVAAQIAQRPLHVAYEAAIHPTSGPSDLELAAAYLPYIEGTRRVGFAATFGRADFFIWTTRENCRCLALIDQPWTESARTREEERKYMAAWLGATQAERIVVIDAPDRYEAPSIGWTHDKLVGILDAMGSQERFILIATVPMPAFPAQVTVWALRESLLETGSE